MKFSHRLKLRVLKAARVRREARVREIVVRRVKAIDHRILKGHRRYFWMKNKEIICK